MVSLLAGVCFPFVSAALSDGSDMSYLMRVNQDFLRKTFSFAAVFFAIQCIWAIFLYRRDQNRSQEASK
jgi:preprotein translocase subunit SecG